MSTQKLNKEVNRLKTFEQWNNTNVSPKDLARIGFVHLESDKNQDKVQCVFCGLILYNWLEGDVPAQEHYKHSRNCSLLRGDATHNKPIDRQLLKDELPAISIDECGYTKFPDLNYCYNSKYVDLQKRIDSFETWPTSMEQKPQELAEAGFFYTGYSDKVICFYCNIGLKDWERDDIPIEEHIKHSSKCQFLYLVKDFQYINDIRKKSTEIILNQPANDQPAADESSDNLPNFTCVCCKDKFSNIMFETCNHCVTCVKCSSELKNCPMCRNPISKKVKIYFP